MGIVLVLMETLMVSTGIWRILLGGGGMLNPIEKCPKHTTKRNYVMVLLEKANGILMETIGISVMVSIGILLFYIAGWKPSHTLWWGKWQINFQIILTTQNNELPRQ